MSKALVLLSGGQDSTTCAVLAKEKYEEIHGLTIFYGQRHQIEIESAKAIAGQLKLHTHEIVYLPDDILMSTSPLVSDNQLGKYSDIKQLPSGIEPTFVPARNILFLTLAANRAIALGCDAIYTGVSQEDYGGYPDCREDFIDKMKDALISGLGHNLSIHTPLMHVSKTEEVLMVLDVLGIEKFNDLFSLTHTCYDGVKGGCGRCHACILRDDAFRVAGIDDPIWRFRR